MLQHFWPSLLAVLKKQTGVEFNAAVYLQFGGLAMLVADLWVGEISIGVSKGGDDVMVLYFVGCSLALDEQHVCGPIDGKGKEIEDRIS